MNREGRLHGFLNRGIPNTETPLDELVYAERLVPVPVVEAQPVSAADAGRLVDILKRLKTDEEAAGLKITIERPASQQAADRVRPMMPIPPGTQETLDEESGSAKTSDKE